MALVGLPDHSQFDTLALLHGGTSLIRNRFLLRPYIGLSLGPFSGPGGGDSVSYERGTPVQYKSVHLSSQQSACPPRGLAHIDSWRAEEEG